MVHKNYINFCFNDNGSNKITIFMLKRLPIIIPSTSFTRDLFHRILHDESVFTKTQFYGFTPQIILKVPLISSALRMSESKSIQK